MVPSRYGVWLLICRDHGKAREINAFRTIDVWTIGGLRRDDSMIDYRRAGTIRDCGTMVVVRQ